MRPRHLVPSAAALAFTLTGATVVAGPPATDALTLEVDARVVNAARELGDDVVFFTARAQPLDSLAALGDPAASVGTADVGLARPMIAVLRAGGVDVSGGAFDLMRLVSEPHFARLFTEEKRLRFFALRARPDGAERAIVETGGGRRLLLRARGNASLVAGAGIAAGAPRPADPAAHAFTSFGVLVRGERSATARQRSWDAVEGARVQTLQARAGRAFVVLHLDRDLGTGLGLVSFLFGSGVVIKPAFERLVLKDGAGARHAPAAVFAEGRTLELAYDLPATATGLRLEDGDHSLALAPLLSQQP